MPSKSHKVFKTPQGQVGAEVDWQTGPALASIYKELEKRVGLATSILRDVVIVNISRPVTILTGPRGGRIKRRSVKGEFPRKDIGILASTIMSGVINEREGVYDGWVGTPMEYGLFLEVKMERPFLTRTLAEETNTIRAIITRPIT